MVLIACSDGPTPTPVGTATANQSVTIAATLLVPQPTPTHTPQPVIEKLRATVAKVMQTPDVVKRLETSGIRPLSIAPNDSERFVKAESEKWAQFLRNAGIKAE